MGLMKTQSKPIAAARDKCSSHCENLPASNGNRLYKTIASTKKACPLPIGQPKHRYKKTGGLLAQAARNQTQGVEARYAIGTAHSSRLKVSLFASTMMTKAVGHTIPWFFGMPYGSHGGSKSRRHTIRDQIRIPRDIPNRQFSQSAAPGFA